MPSSKATCKSRTNSASVCRNIASFVSRTSRPPACRVYLPRNCSKRQSFSCSVCVRFADEPSSSDQFAFIRRTKFKIERLSFCEAFLKVGEWMSQFLLPKLLLVTTSKPIIRDACSAKSRIALGVIVKQWAWTTCGCGMTRMTDDASRIMLAPVAE